MVATPPPPGGQRILRRRRQVQSSKEKKAKQTPTSARSAGFGGSSGSILKVFTEEANAFRIDSLIVLFLAFGFVLSVFGLHIVNKMSGRLY
ncbi:hypothetical protein TPHA_0E01040 [Tetrapisispora phaffii CBS 4417]|uniref:Protein transport protein Sec61 subunit beta n=1 Tax=Tetrapisispora phaffii (strain ATCC 24235 / CBS 4417 / NBRC 1672 / NRRL Y-8282 / UCD 70-5) TaxID=1071381 RepID=G8BTH0_TETPH|nr:hypothetical protein TPHA_0E01040 [Tetrapisispora phaffii CBS 4417]CCE63198.1 hypothetical protein TPHA_0E01040 [Tetrapisispora phaffii CBS 4417]